MRAITSNPHSDPASIQLVDTDFSSGSLARTSCARPGKLFTANESLFQRSVAVLGETALRRVLTAIVALFSR